MKLTRDSSGIKRTSFDLEPDNSKNLGSFAGKTNQSYGAAMNFILRTLFKLRPNIVEMLVNACARHASELKKEMEQMTAFEKQDSIHELQQCRDLISLFNGGEITEGDVDGMKKILLKEGFVLIPDKSDWIVLDNFSNPSDCMWAGVVEVKNGAKYNAKHYVFFSDYKYGCDFPSDLQSKIVAACIEKDADFQSIVDAEVEPDYQGKSKIFFNMVNREEWAAAPHIGLFAVAEQGDPMYWNIAEPDYEPPFGVVIKRSFL